MTIDDRLEAAAADLGERAGTVDGAASFVRFRRRRRRLASMSGVAALLLFGLGLVAVLLPDDDGSSQVAAQSREQVANQLEKRLLVAADIGPGWAKADLDATPAPSDTCGLADVEARIAPLAAVHREFATAQLSLVGERISGYRDGGDADGVISALRRAFEGCTDFSTENPQGGTTEGALHPLSLDVHGVSSFAMTGDLSITDEKGARSTASAFWVAVGHRNLVAIIFGVNFTDAPTSPAAIAHIAQRAADRLNADG